MALLRAEVEGCDSRLPISRADESWASVHPSVCPSVRPSDHPSVRPSVHPSVRPSIHLSVHPSVHPSIRSPPRGPKSQPGLRGSEDWLDGSKALKGGNGWTDGQTDGRMDGRTDGRTDRWTDGWKYFVVSITVSSSSSADECFCASAGMPL